MPTYVPVTVTTVLCDTTWVPIEKVLYRTPPGTVTDPGVFAAEELSDKVITAPLRGAGAFRVALPTVDTPPFTVLGEVDKLERYTTGRTVIVEVKLAPLKLAVTVAVCATETEDVVAPNVVVALPAGIVTEVGVTT